MPKGIKLALELVLIRGSFVVLTMGSWEINYLGQGLLKLREERMLSPPKDKLQFVVAAAVVIYLVFGDKCDNLRKLGGA